MSQIPSLVDKVVLHWSDGCAETEKEFKSIEDFQTFVQLRIRCKAPEDGSYDKTKFSVHFTGNSVYTGRWDVQRHQQSYQILEQMMEHLRWMIVNVDKIGGDAEFQRTEREGHLKMLEICIREQERGFVARNLKFVS